MSWPLAFLIFTMWFSLLFFSFCLYVYIKEYKREEEYFKQLDNVLFKPLPLVSYETYKDDMSKSSKKETLIDNTSLPNIRNKSKKNIN
jgi:hypothetical protein